MVVAKKRRAQILQRHRVITAETEWRGNAGSGDGATGGTGIIIAQIGPPAKMKASAHLLLRQTLLHQTRQSKFWKNRYTSAARASTISRTSRFRFRTTRSPWSRASRAPANRRSPSTRF